MALQFKIVKLSIAQRLHRDTHTFQVINLKYLMCVFVFKKTFKVWPQLQMTQSRLNLVSQDQIFMPFCHFLISVENSISKMGLITEAILGPTIQTCQVLISGDNKIASVHLNLSSE